LKQKRGMLPIVIAVLAAGLAVLGSAGGASAAGSCTTAVSHAWSGGSWTPSGSNFAAGVQAPVQLWANSNICNASSGEGDQASSWISIVPSTGGLIAQIGFTKVIDNPSTGSVRTCRFWAIGSGQGHVYACGADSTGDRVWFRITAMPNADGMGHYYYLEDCGPDVNYDGCVTKNLTQPAWSDGQAYILSEVSYGCQDQMPGSSSSRVSFGTSTFPIKAQNGYGDAWAVRSLGGYLYGPCGTSHFHYSVTNPIVTTWDDRN